MEKALKVIAGRYSEQQLMKAQDIIGDLKDELIDAGFDKGNVKVAACDIAFDLLSDAINLDA